MEKSIFPKAAVAAELVPHFVEARLHCDGEVNIDRIKQLQRDLAGTLANPYFVVIDPVDEASLAQASFMTESNFVRFLQGARG